MTRATAQPGTGTRPGCTSKWPPNRAIRKRRRCWRICSGFRMICTRTPRRSPSPNRNRPRRPLPRRRSLRPSPSLRRKLPQRPKPRIRSHRRFSSRECAPIWPRITQRHFPFFSRPRNRATPRPNSTAVSCMMTARARQRTRPRPCTGMKRPPGRVTPGHNLAAAGCT